MELEKPTTVDFSKDWPETPNGTQAKKSVWIAFLERHQSSFQSTVFPTILKIIQSPLLKFRFQSGDALIDFADSIVKNKTQISSVDLALNQVLHFFHKNLDSTASDTKISFNSMLARWGNNNNFPIYKKLLDLIKNTKLPEIIPKKLSSSFVDHKEHGSHIHIFISKKEKDDPQILSILAHEAGHTFFKNYRYPTEDFQKNILFAEVFHEEFYFIRDKFDYDLNHSSLKNDDFIAYKTRFGETLADITAVLTMKYLSDLSPDQEIKNVYQKSIEYLLLSRASIDIDFEHDTYEFLHPVVKEIHNGTISFLNHTPQQILQRAVTETLKYYPTEQEFSRKVFETNSCPYFETLLLVVGGIAHEYHKFAAADPKISFPHHKNLEKFLKQHSHAVAIAKNFTDDELQTKLPDSYQCITPEKIKTAQMVLALSEAHNLRLESENYVQNIKTNAEIQISPNWDNAPTQSPLVSKSENKNRKICFKP